MFFTAITTVDEHPMNANRYMTIIACCNDDSVQLYLKSKYICATAWGCNSMVEIVLKALILHDEAEKEKRPRDKKTE